MFSDIKQSYERTTAKLVQEKNRLQDEVIKEKRLRIKSEKVAEEVTLTEKSRVREIQTKYQEKMKKIIDDEKQKVENQYRWNLENYKRQNMELR